MIQMISLSDISPFLHQELLLELIISTDQILFIFPVSIISDLTQILSPILIDRQENISFNNLTLFHTFWPDNKP